MTTPAETTPFDTLPDELIRDAPPERLAELAQTDSRGAPIIRPGLHHLSLQTGRLAEMIEWYRQVVGLQVVHQLDGAAWLTNDEANHRLALVSSEVMKIDITDDPEKATHAGLYHSSWEYRSLDELLDSYSRLKSLGIVPYRTINHGPTMSFYYRDPDGNVIELQSDNFGDWTRSRLFMTSSAEFERDPLGPAVDPDVMIEQRAAGSSALDLIRRSYSGQLGTADPDAGDGT